MDHEGGRLSDRCEQAQRQGEAGRKSRTSGSTGRAARTLSERRTVGFIVLDTNTIKLPEDIGPFFTLVVEKTEKGDFIVRGLGDKNAVHKLNKLAETAYPELKAAKDEAEKKAVAQAEIIDGISSGSVKLTPELIASAKAQLKAKRAVAQN